MKEEVINTNQKEKAQKKEENINVLVLFNNSEELKAIQDKIKNKTISISTENSIITFEFSYMNFKKDLIIDEEYHVIIFGYDISKIFPTKTILESLKKNPKLKNKFFVLGALTFGNIKGKNTTKQYIKKRHNFYKHNEELIYENPLLPFDNFLNLLYVEYKRKQLAKEYKNKNLIGKDVENTVYYCC